ncbi:MAG: phosphotransferase [Candidatus Amulumruptor caecigallinarius]|nr:phosphotransferase [Candidatus Amulumruptor caecigallinarius]
MKNSEKNIVGILSDLYIRHFMCEPVSVVPIAAGGGNRKYYRISGAGGNAIGVEGDVRKDCESFIALSHVFSDNNIRVPEIFERSDSGMHYIQQDLGNRSMFDALQEVSVESVKHLFSATLSELVKMQTLSEDLWLPCVVYPPFGERLVRFDLNYFKYEFVKASEIEFDEDALEDDFDRMIAYLLSCPDSLWGFMMRDCQSRNVMLSPEPYFIDYQGGRRGPALYDAVSLLWQAKAALPMEIRRDLSEEYANLFASRREGVSPDEILQRMPMFALLRVVQTLGAYGFRGLVEKKSHFIKSIPYAITNLKFLLDQGAVDPYPQLKLICEKLVCSNKYKSTESDGLTVTIFSFSYKKGYPTDMSGNGGGFMFDCRGMHNPGRYDEYKPLTGRDKPVVDFLEQRGEVQKFVDTSFQLVDDSIKTYLRRGFSSLQIGFGCTGGRHRSVYCADRLSKMIARDFPQVKVRLVHREQNIEEWL